MEEKFYTKAEAGEEIDKKIAEFMKQYGEVDYSRAYVKVLELNPELASAYVMGVTTKREYKAQEREGSKQDAGARIARMIDEVMLVHNVDADRARDYVMRDPENETLVKEYIFGA